MSVQRTANRDGEVSDGQPNPSLSREDPIGQLTGALAHDFNNLLTVIMGASEVLADLLAAAPTERDLALVSLRAAEHGADQIRRLLNLSHCSTEDLFV